ncbi:hypothetical protein ACPPVW_17250 [Leifsonia sp. McL0607]|uniref:hypothetical protein n=1 Tax=Leifsonia sp. McL0607 TaxID=3415672 RepID=UPI003CF7D68E
MWIAVSELPPEIIPAWIEAVATAVGVLVAILAIVFAYAQIRQTATQMRLASAREAQDSEEQTRPYIGVDLVPGLGGPPSFDLVIENFGRATARDLKISLVDDSFQAQSAADEIGPALGRLFESGFDLAPGARRRIFWRLPSSEDASPPGDFGAPIAGEITTTYTWQAGDDRGKRAYEDRLRYDLTEYPKLTPAPAKGATTSGQNIEAQAKNAVHALRAIAEHVAEIRR